LRGFFLYSYLPLASFKLGVFLINNEYTTFAANDFAILIAVFLSLQRTIQFHNTILTLMFGCNLCQNICFVNHIFYKKIKEYLQSAILFV